MESAIEIVRILKEYKNFKLDVANLRILKGEKVGIIGNNGMGKTTLLLSILNLIATKKNKTSLYGIPNDLDKWKEMVSAYIDSSFLIDFLSVREYVQFICSFHNINDSLVDSKIEVFNDFLGETYDVKKLIRDHSLGNARKAGIIGCLIPEVSCYILDEPFDNLDPRSRKKLSDIIMKNYREQTFIISSHDLKHTYEICERFIILKDGKVFCDCHKDSVTESELEQCLIN